MRRKLLLIVIPAAGAIGSIALATAASGASSAPSSPVAVTAISAATPATGQPRAEQAALAYLSAHYPGSGTARVLSTQADREHGQAVYEITAVAPDGGIYEVYVSQATDTVLSAGREDSEEAQGAQVHGTASPGGQRAGHDDSPDQQGPGYSGDQFDS